MSSDSIDARYFAAMRARDLDGLLALFADDASLGLPDGREIAGRPALEQWFRALFGGAAPSPSAVAVIRGPGGVATEIETQLADGKLRRTANFFHLNAAGLIARLRVYARS
jgi:ketosteroid isomerase-like protein